MVSRAREGCQPVRQTNLFLVLQVGPWGTFQKVRTASQQSPGTASVCERLVELGSCDRVPRKNGVEADKDFPSRLRSNDNGHLVLECINTNTQQIKCCVDLSEFRKGFLGSDKMLRFFGVRLFAWVADSGLLCLRGFRQLLR